MGSDGERFDGDSLVSRVRGFAELGLAIGIGVGDFVPPDVVRVLEAAEELLGEA